jgi:hypothetical protein
LVVVVAVELTVVILFFLLLLLLVADQAAQAQQVVRLELAVVREAEGNIKVLVVLAQQIRVGLVVLGQQMQQHTLRLAVAAVRAVLVPMVDILLVVLAVAVLLQALREVLLLVQAVAVVVQTIAVLLAVEVLVAEQQVKTIHREQEIQEQ